MLETLQGKKTYIVAGLATITTLIKYLGYIDEDTYQLFMGFIGAGGAATLAAKMNRVDKKMIPLLFLLLIPTVVGAQAIPTSKLAWDQVAPDLVSAQAYTYKYYPDGSTTGTSLASVTCTGAASPFQCEVAFPSFTPGNHNLTLTASNIAGESGKSSPFAFVFVVTPGIPTNIHIK